MDFSKLNDVCRGGNFLPTKSWDQLEVEINYKVTEMKTVETKFGESIVMTLHKEFTVFLPSRIVKYLLKERDQYKLLADAAVNEKLNMHYIGGQYRECEFINVE
ncbi:hypothetical protein PV326_013047 [Microctonus aethiopoides]|nr:hypothetical protein PV326_013047 [Microctonus aethiopoides]